MKTTAGKLMRKASELGWTEVKRGKKHEGFYFFLNGKKYELSGKNLLASLRTLAEENEYTPAGEVFSELYWEMTAG